MGDSATKKASAGQYTHWARPRWIRMYNYNYCFGESYYRPQVQYMSTSKVASEINSSYSSNVSASSASSYDSSSSRSYRSRRRSVSPPRAMTFIERWTSQPFYDYGFSSHRSSSAARNVSSSSSLDIESSSLRRAESRERALSQSRTTRAQSIERESSELRSTRAQSIERASSELRSTRASSELRSRRAQSEAIASRYSGRSNYASTSLLNQINHVRATSAAVQEEAGLLRDRLRQRRAHSLEALQRAESPLYAATAASDDCLMRSDALDSSRRGRREQSILEEIGARYGREGSLSRVEDEEFMKNYKYPTHHLVCTESCPFYTDPVHHRRFVIGQKFNDAAALGGFDVIYDPTVLTKSKRLLQRLSEERDVDTILYESTRESSVERSRARGRSSSRYATIY